MNQHMDLFQLPKGRFFRECPDNVAAILSSCLVELKLHPANRSICNGSRRERRRWKVASSAFQSSRQKPLHTEPFPVCIMISTKRYKNMAATLCTFRIGALRFQLIIVEIGLLAFGLHRLRRLEALSEGFELEKGE